MGAGVAVSVAATVGVAVDAVAVAVGSSGSEEPSQPAPSASAIVATPATASAGARRTRGRPRLSTAPLLSTARADSHQGCGRLASLSATRILVTHYHPDVVRGRVRTLAGAELAEDSRSARSDAGV